MSSEIKAISIIVVITVLVIIGGLSLTKNGPAKGPSITVDPAILVTPDNPKQLGANANMKVQVVEFGDFACPACAALAPNLDAALTAHKDSVDFTLRLIPIHGQDSYDSATAAFAAGEQGKFFEMGKILFDKQTDWFGKGNKRELFLGYAQSLNLDITKFTTSIDSPDFKTKVKKILDKDGADAAKMNIMSTPTLVMNTTPVVGVQSVDTLKAMILAELAKTSGLSEATTTAPTATTTGQ